MPTKRRRTAHVRTDLDYELMAFHMEMGDCLLAGRGKGCGCGLVDADGMFRDDLLEQLRAHEAVRAD